MEEDLPSLRGVHACEERLNKEGVSPRFHEVPRQDFLVKQSGTRRGKAQEFYTISRPLHDSHFGSLQMFHKVNFLNVCLMFL